MKILVAAAALGLVAFTGAEATAQKEIDARVVVTRARGPARSGKARLRRALLRRLRRDIVDVDGTARTGRSFKVPQLARAGERLGADYVLRLSVKKKGWQYTARAILIESDTGIVQLDFRSGYYKPQAEAADRGDRIAHRMVERLRELTAPPEVPVATGEIREVLAFDAEPAPERREVVEPEPAPVAEDAPDSSEEAFFADDAAPADEAAFFADGVVAETKVGAAEELDGFEFVGLRWTYGGWVGSLYRTFLGPDLDEGKGRHFAKVGVRANVTARAGQWFRLRLLPRIEASLIDPGLHRAYVEEGFVELAFEHFEMRVGWDALSWGSASTVKIADVVNARDFREGFTDAPKIGQPMLVTRFLFGNHYLSLLYLTPFMPPRFAEPSSAFSPFPAEVGDDGAFGRVLLGARLGRWHPQAAARLSFSFPHVDVRANYFYGYRRTPVVHLPTETLVFPLIHNASLEAQLLLGNTSFKVEGASVWHQKTSITERPPITLDNGTKAASILLPGQRFSWVAGIEHNFDDFLFGSLFVPYVEFLGDSDSELFTDHAPPDDVSRFFGNHLIYGFRWELQNDVDSKIKLSDLMDVANATDHLFQLEYSERFLTYFTFVLGGQLGIARDGNKMSGFRDLTGLYTELRFNY